MVCGRRIRGAAFDDCTVCLSIEQLEIKGMGFLETETLKLEFKSVAQTIYYDVEDNLREKTNNPKAIKKFLEKVEALLVNERENRYLLYGMIGNLYRILEEPKKAIDYLERALGIAKEENDDAKIAVSLIRLGEAIKYDGKRQRAFDIFEEAMGILHKHDLEHYLDFALQHKGKCLLELKRYEEAEDCFRETLEIRKRKKDASLIDSTEQVLTFMEEMEF